MTEEASELKRLWARIQQLELLLAQAELKSLENQIKPHFLFNTLNLVARLIYLERNQESLEVVHALSKLLRYAMEKKEHVRVRDEIQYIKNYLFIQQSRYGEQLQYKLDISQNILNCLIPTLSLQPLVDNAIKHGLEPKGGGSIRIIGRMKGNKVFLQVIDDGLGFAKAHTADESVTNSIGSGLGNIKKRLKFYYGEEFSLTISSQENVETEVTLAIPCKNDEDDSYIPVFWFDK